MVTSSILTLVLVAMDSCGNVSILSLNVHYDIARVSIQSLGLVIKANIFADLASDLLKVDFVLSDICLSKKNNLKIKCE